MLKIAADASEEVPRLLTETAVLKEILIERTAVAVVTAIHSTFLQEQ